MESEVGLFEEIPIVFGGFVRVGGRGVGSVDRGRLGIVAGGLAEDLGIGEDGFHALLGDAGGFVALEADIALQLVKGGDETIWLHDAGAATEGQGLIQLQEVALEDGEVGRRRRGGLRATTDQDDRQSERDDRCHVTPFHGHPCCQITPFCQTPK